MTRQSTSNVLPLRARPLTPKVSVIIPCFNSSATLGESIAGVRAQTFGDFEIIVVDDGSSDGSMDVLVALAREEPRLRFFGQANAGPATARNTGVSLARGELLAFLDADDVWLPSHLYRHVEAMWEDPRLGVSFSPCDLIDEQSNRTGEQTRTWLSNVQPKDLLGSNPTGTCSSLVIRREAFMMAGPMRTDMGHAEDQEWLFRVALSGWLVRGIEEHTVLYRTSTSGLSSDASKMMDGWQHFIDHARELAPDLVERYLAKATAQIHLYHARRAIRTGQPPEVARWHLAAALGASPSTVSSRPIHFAALTGAAIAPGLANRAVRFVRSLRYA